MKLAVSKFDHARKPAPAAVTSHNPYLAARREWDERYGDLISRARNLRVVAFLCAATALFDLRHDRTGAPLEGGSLYRCGRFAGSSSRLGQSRAGVQCR